MTETEARIVNEFIGGADVPTIAARYAVSEDYVDELIDHTHVDKPIKVRRRFDWSFNPWGNRLFYSLVAGTVVNLALHTYALGCVIAVVLFVLTTAIVTAARRS